MRIPKKAANLRELLTEMIIENGHDAPPEDFSPVRKNSYFQLLSENTDPETNRRTARVRCVCGKELTLPYRTVNQGYKTSCGCRDIKTVDRINAFRDHVKRLDVRREDLRTSGLHGDGVHGFLKVTGFQHRQGKFYWEAECACGSVILVSRRSLLHRKSDTCGDRQCRALRSQGYTREEARTMYVAARKAMADPNHLSFVKPVATPSLKRSHRINIMEDPKIKAKLYKEKDKSW